ncbi:MAG: type II toxin-antitoxin system prevent-host-death family antitoxin [Spirochaetales bacterium]|jgi:prevent-host-death family protein|nr:type II toxin-antitoxin system prevent-host-death family antitoxin [Spirochaetales bacterium]
MTIGAFEAKTRFSEIIADVENGKDYIVTRRGKPVAKIIPFAESLPTRRQAIRNLMEQRKLFKGRGTFDIRKAIDEGRP